SRPHSIAPLQLAGNRMPLKAPITSSPPSPPPRRMARLSVVAPPRPSGHHVVAGVRQAIGAGAAQTETDGKSHTHLFPSERWEKVPLPVALANLICPSP